MSHSFSSHSAADAAHCIYSATDAAWNIAKDPKKIEEEKLFDFNVFI